MQNTQKQNKKANLKKSGKLVNLQELCKIRKNVDFANVFRFCELCREIQKCREIRKYRKTFLL